MSVLHFGVTDWPLLVSWQAFWIAVSISAAGAAMIHVLLHKRDPRSAAYWVALVLLVPIAGSILYLLLGINFIRREARRLRPPESTSSTLRADSVSKTHFQTTHTPSLDTIDLSTEFDVLATTLDRISRFDFTTGNSVRILHNGDEALPEMIAAIRSAQTSVTLSSYIFEASGIGGEFVDALSDATSRGVQVRVMVDDAGTKYSWPPITRELSRRGISVKRFMPNRLVVRLLTFNLRNHRKLLIIDGKRGFTGGMNIREGNMLARQPAHPVQDLHFAIEGPVVSQLQHVFAEDWEFCCGETLTGPEFYPALSPSGTILALGLPDGPDGDMEVMPAALFASLNAARRSVKILTPYFLPSPTLSWALNLCVVRGVEVTIVSPAENNIKLVAWAARTLYPELIRRGCAVFESPAPFDHSKIFLVDDLWSFVGSTNWDPRSLRLNFEFNLACFDADLGARLAQEFEIKRSVSHRLTLEELAADPVLRRLRNGFARLFIPLL